MSASATLQEVALQQITPQGCAPRVGRYTCITISAAIDELTQTSNDGKNKHVSACCSHAIEFFFLLGTETSVHYLFSTSGTAQTIRGDTVAAWPKPNTNPVEQAWLISQRTKITVRKSGRLRIALFAGTWSAPPVIRHPSSRASRVLLTTF